MIQSVSNSLPQFNIGGVGIVLVEYGLICEAISFMAKRILGVDICLPGLLLTAFSFTLMLNDFLKEISQKIFTAQNRARRNEWQ